MAKQLEAFVKEYAALIRELDGASVQLKEAEQHRAQHEQAVREQARLLAQRVGVLRAGGTAGAGLEPFQNDPEVRRLLGGLDEQLARAETDRLHDHGLAVGAWSALLKRTAALEKELAAEIAARQKLATTKTGLGNKSVADMLLLQADVRKKLAPRRTALQTGEQALVYHQDPEYFSKRRDEALAAALGTASGATTTGTAAPKKPALAGAAPPKPAPKNAGAPGPTKTGTPSTSATQTSGKPPVAPPLTKPVATAPTLKAATSPSAATPSAVTKSPDATGPTPTAVTGSTDSLLTVATFKLAGTEARQLFAAIRSNTLVARKAAKTKNGAALAQAKAAAAQRMESLERLVKQYELARAATTDKALAQLPNGRQILTGIKSLVAVRAKARAMIRALAKLR